MRYEQANSQTDRLSSDNEPAEAKFSEAELHERLVPFKHDDFVYDDETLRPVLEIIDDQTIALNGIKMVLSRTKRFIVNALHLSHGYTQTGPQIRELGFQGTETAFSRGMEQLLASLEAISGTPIVVREIVGNARSYVLLPEVRVVDDRDKQAERSLKERLIQQGVTFEQPERPLLLDTGAIAFKSPKYRAAITKQMVNEFRDRSQADATLLGIFDQGIGRRSLSRPILPLHDIPILDRAAEDALLAKKEEALMAYLSNSDVYDETSVACIIEGLRASFELFAHNAGLVKAYAMKHSRPAIPFQELYQEGAAQLLEAIMYQPYDRTGNTADFRLIATYYIKQAINKVRRDEILPSLSYARESDNDKDRLFEIIEALHEEFGYIPDIETISQRAQMRKDRVLGLISLARRSLSLDEPIFADDIGGLTVGETIAQEDFVEAELNRAEREEAVDTLFTSKELPDSEKIILSLHYQLFHRSLCGAEVMFPGHEGVFTYPYTKEDFFELVGKGLDLQAISADILKRSHGYAAELHKRALGKARSLLAQKSIAETYNYHSEEAGEQEANERQQIIDEALGLSPDKPLTWQAITNLSRAGKFPSGKHIKALFGSVPQFQQACGFEPHDKKAMARAMSNEEIVALALKLQPHAPLKKSKIMQLSANGEFVRYETIHARFGSMAAFHTACGF